MATKIARLVTIGAVAAATAVGSPAMADDGGHGEDRAPRFDVINQVSDQESRRPAVVDPDAVNSWGLALGPRTPLWVANNGTNTATVYRGGVDGEPVKKVDLTVTIPGGAPTGAAFNDTDGFEVPGRGDDEPARFIFVSEGGDVTAWNPNAGTKAVVVAHRDDAIYKGVALLKTDFGDFLLATDFHNARIDVFNEDFEKVALPDFAFQDEDIPDGFAPFNVFTVDERVYVTYAKQDADAEDDVAGAGFGFVDLFTHFGTDVRRVASEGTLNAPWGLAIAPDSFGEFAGDLLVGNFGDGRINVFDGDEFEGQLRDDDGDTISIDGLWALLPGTETTGGEDALWFSAGPDDEQHGLVGQLIPTS
ncbi:TIGR03118 family protein [Micromonospora inositola]|uniref:TIGR03118 family protein n=1 Tax=Micromonospora inositola TaxID=47865 RepID=A0A1C5GQA9_9ACTN|nr:TIGR03118 family protein [Micromonospora inositola]SCG35965.1 TIGR03118 family protein [Micromonospora inositola]